MKKFFLSFILLIFSFFSYAQIVNGGKTWSRQKVISSDSFVYNALCSLAGECGQTTLATSMPCPVSELEVYLSQIDYDSLSDYGKSLYDSVYRTFHNSYFAFSSELLSLGVNFDASEEVSVPYRSALARSFDYNHRFYNQKPFVNIPLSLSAGDWIYFECPVEVVRNYWAVNESVMPLNFPWDPQYSFKCFNFHFPRNACMCVSFPFYGTYFWNLQVGKSSLQYGRTYSDSIIYSRFFETDFYAKLSLFSPRIKYEGSVSQLEVNKFLYLHKLDARPFKCLSLGLGGGTLVNAPFELRFLNPFMIQHSFAARATYGDYNKGLADGSNYSSVNSHVSQLFFASLNYVPVKSLLFYILYTQNEIQSASELNTAWGKLLPNSLGVQAGFDYSLHPSYDSTLTFGIEGLYLSPYCYLRHELGNSFVRSRVDELMGNGRKIWSWIGSQYGPDSLAASAYACFAKNQFKCSLSYEFLAKGEQGTDLFSYVDSNGKYIYYPTFYGEGKRFANYEQAVAAARNMFLSGVLEHIQTVTLGVNYSFYSWLHLLASASYRFIINSNHSAGNSVQGFQFSIATTVNII